MSEDFNEIRDVVELFCDAVRKHGKTRILKGIEIANSKSLEGNSSKIVDLCIKFSCEAYGFKKEQILTNRISNDCNDCKQLAIVLVKHHTRLSHRQIADIFKYKNISNISIALKEFKNKDERFKQDALFLKHYQSIYLEIDKFKTIL
jgi:chromosomal replication initiation ATPase DnaA